MRLLYVEDNARLASNTAASLRKSSFVVDAVSTGEDAIHAAKSFAYDAIVLDLGLPDIDGLTVLERIRAARPGTPVVI
ncbi:response regulator, partial [Salmonella enterica subsp. enterica serovar 1,4,[5],12:i:-]